MRRCLVAEARSRARSPQVEVPPDAGDGCPERSQELVAPSADLPATAARGGGHRRSALAPRALGRRGDRLPARPPPPGPAEVPRPPPAGARLGSMGRPTGWAASRARPTAGHRLRSLRLREAGRPLGGRGAPGRGRVGAAESRRAAISPADASRRGHARVDVGPDPPVTRAKDRARRDAAGVPGSVRSRARHERASEMPDRRGAAAPPRGWVAGDGQRGPLVVEALRRRGRARTPSLVQGDSYVVLGARRVRAPSGPEAK
jgi:hypothetical protein